MSSRPVFVVSEVFAVNLNKQILLIRRSKTAPRRPLEWDIPGGWVEQDEHPMDAAIRELKEETGLVVPAVEQLLIRTEERDNEQITRHYYVAKVGSKQPTVKLSFEHDDYIWATAEKYNKIMLYKPHLEAFQSLVLVD